MPVSVLIISKYIMRSHISHRGDAMLATIYYIRTQTGWICLYGLDTMVFASKRVASCEKRHN